MKQRLLAPIKAFKLAYLPLLAVYFAVGFMGIDAVTKTFFFKNVLSLSATDLISIAIWAQLPWTIKMVFGSIIDGIPLFGSHRKSYIILGSLLTMCGSFLMVDIASTQYSVGYLGEYGALLFSGLLTVMGIVTADIVADTMAIEVVEKDDEYEYNLAMVQVLSRLSISFGGVLAAALTGYLAANFDPAVVFSFAAMVPIIAIVGAIAVKLKNPVENELISLNKPILLGGLAFGIFCAVSGLLLGQYSQIVVFVGSMFVINYMLWTIVKDMDPTIRNPFLLACIAIFLFRTVPGVGPGEEWWFISSIKDGGLGFDEEFIGLLRIIGNVSAMGVLWLLSETVAKSGIKTVMLTLVIAGTALFLPQIGVYYGLHEYFGLTARNVMLVDTAFVAPLGNLSMIPLGVLIAKNAPPEKRALYISLTASFMNMALVGGDLITKVLNQVYVVTRSDFSQLGELMIVSLVISTVLSLVGILFLKNEK